MDEAISDQHVPLAGRASSRSVSPEDSDTPGAPGVSLLPNQVLKCYGASTNWISSSSPGAYCSTMPRIHSMTASVSVRNAKPVPPQVWRLKPKSHELTPTITLELKPP